MRIAILGCSLAALVLGQGGAGFGRMAGNGNPNFGGAGFGRILFPGTGAPAAVRTPGARHYIPTPPPAFHPNGHGGGVLIPYPVYYGGGYYPYDAPPAGDASAPPPDGQYASPVIITNQNFHPDAVNPVIHDYTDVPLPEPVPVPVQAPRPAVSNNTSDDSPTIYLIAMKDGSIFAAIAYWADGDTLNYVTKDANINHASLALVDRDFSKQLNQERGVEFKLPAAK